MTHRITLALAFWVLLTLSGTALHAADLNATADATVNKASPTVSSGSNGVIAVSSSRIALIRFDPNAVAQSSGGSATLKLKVIVTTRSSNGLAISMVRSNWAEKTVTANTLPVIDSAVLDQKVITTKDAGKVVTFDVSAAVAAWRSNPSSNFGLAIVAASPVPDVQIGAREMGAGAQLSFSSVVAADNDVTVAPSGADYPNPLLAARNATEGDHWCVSSSVTRPCTIHIAAGTYVLDDTIEPQATLKFVGEERGETLLLAKSPGHAFFVSGPSLILTDLTLTSAGEGIIFDSSGALQLERVRLAARGLAIPLGRFSAVSIIDSEIAVEGDAEAIVFDMDTGGGPFKLIRSRISALSKNGYAGISDMVDSDPFTEITVQDSLLTAWGANGAAAFRSSDEFSSFLITGSTIEVSSPRGALGLSGNDAQLQVINSRIGAHGDTGTSEGISWEGAYVVVDDSTIDASTTAIEIQPPIYGGDFGDIKVMRSRITAGSTAFSLTHSNANVQSSIVTAPTGGQLMNGSKLTATSSQLTGAIRVSDEDGEGTSSASCTKVLDGNFAVRPAKCVP